MELEALEKRLKKDILSDLIRERLWGMELGLQRRYSIYGSVASLIYHLGNQLQEQIAQQHLETFEDLQSCFDHLEQVAATLAYFGGLHFATESKDYPVDKYYAVVLEAVKIKKGAVQFINEADRIYESLCKDLEKSSQTALNAFYQAKWMFMKIVLHRSIYYGYEDGIRLITILDSCQPDRKLLEVKRVLLENSIPSYQKQLKDIQAQLGID